MIDLSKINGFVLGRSTKYSIDDLYKMAEFKEYEIMSDLDEHIVVRDRINLKCKKHNSEFETTIENFMNEIRNNCLECRAEHLSEVQRESTIEEVLEIMRSKNYTLISPNFIANCDEPI